MTVFSNKFDGHLRPAPWMASYIEDKVAFANEIETLLNLLELESRASTIAACLCLTAPRITLVIFNPMVCQVLVLV
jgi:hypothetical protein